MSARVRRVDARLGLAVRRASLSNRTLITYARDHVIVRTPSRAGFRDGNVLDLEHPPEPAKLTAWIDRFQRTVGTLGATHPRLRWETPLAADAPAAPPTPDAGLVGACEELGLALRPLTVSLLAALPPAPAAAVQFVPVAPPSAAPGGVVDRRWHAATVLYRYLEGDSPDDWRGVDQEQVAWSIDVQRELALAGRAQVWLAMRHGAPVGRVTVAHDRQGLAVVDDLIVHPAHRRLGVATALTHEAVAGHLEAHPGSRLGAVAEPGSAADRTWRRLGFVPHATCWQADAGNGGRASHR